MRVAVGDVMCDSAGTNLVLMSPNVSSPGCSCRFIAIVSNVVFSEFVLYMYLEKHDT